MIAAPKIRNKSPHRKKKTWLTSRRNRAKDCPARARLLVPSQTANTANAAPINPSIIPSRRKGTRMNQLDAPTSFMIETSSRRA